MRRAGVTGTVLCDYVRTVRQSIRGHHRKVNRKARLRNIGYHTPAGCAASKYNSSLGLLIHWPIAGINKRATTFPAQEQISAQDVVDATKDKYGRRVTWRSNLRFPWRRL